jgi:hypothetical protein
MGRPKIYLEQVHHTQPEAHGSANRGIESRSDLSPLNQRRLFRSFALSRGEEDTSMPDAWAKCSRSESARNEVFVLQITTYQPRTDEWNVYIDAQLEPSISS